MLKKTTPTMNQLLVPLMTATLAVIMTLAMFAVAVPTIRYEYMLSADIAAWLIVAYTLPFMAFMPLYGRLADVLGKQVLLLLGLGVFLVGSGMLLIAESLQVVLIARFVQGVGSAGVNPIAMAIIVDYAGPAQRGKALGIWNSIGPVSGFLGPLIAGPMIDMYGWRSIIIPSSIAGIIAWVLVHKLLPPEMPREAIGPSEDSKHSGASFEIPEKSLFSTGKCGPKSCSKAGRKSVLRILGRFDWIGVVLFNLMIGFLVFFTSSRPITGQDPLTDMRLFLLFIIFFFMFVVYERRRPDPFLDFSLFYNRNLTLASISVSVRMMLMGGVHFAIPLLVTDLYNFSASQTGLVLVVHSLALFATMRLGGIIIDRWKDRGQIIIGLMVESIAMLMFVLMPQGTVVLLIFIVVGIHGLGAGLCLAALHVFALSTVPGHLSATASGIYSMIRFAGSLFGAAIGGVILELGINRYGITMAAYTPSFLFYFIISLLGALAALGLTRKLPQY